MKFTVMLEYCKHFQTMVVPPPSAGEQPRRGYDICMYVFPAAGEESYRNSLICGYIKSLKTRGIIWTLKKRHCKSITNGMGK